MRSLRREVKNLRPWSRRFMLRAEGSLLRLAKLLLSSKFVLLGNYSAFDMPTRRITDLDVSSKIHVCRFQASHIPREGN
jgi:hypothetical protein